MRRFTKGTPTPVSVRNDVCLKCHQKRERLFWSGSIHETNGLTCTSCHVVHTGPGIANRAQLARISVEDTCNTCHKEQVRAENKFSHHPMREGNLQLRQLPQPARGCFAQARKGYFHQRTLLQLSRPVPRSVPFSTPARHGGSLQLPSAPRQRLSRPAENPATQVVPGSPHDLPQSHFHGPGGDKYKDKDKYDGRQRVRQLSPEHPRQQQYPRQFIL